MAAYRAPYRLYNSCTLARGCHNSTRGACRHGGWAAGLLLSCSQGAVGQLYGVCPVPGVRQALACMRLFHDELADFKRVFEYDADTAVFYTWRTHCSCCYYPIIPGLHHHMSSCRCESGGGGKDGGRLLRQTLAPSLINRLGNQVAVVFLHNNRCESVLTGAELPLWNTASYPCTQQKHSNLSRQAPQCE